MYVAKEQTAETQKRVKERQRKGERNRESMSNTERE